MEYDLGPLGVVSKQLGRQNPLAEAIYKTNVGYDLTANEAQDAIEYALRFPEPNEGVVFLALLLNSVMAKRPTVEEVVGLLRGAFSLDEFDPSSLEEVAIENAIVVGLASSGKKAIKTMNVSSCAAIVAASAGAHVLKPCSHATSSLTGSSDFAKAVGMNILLNKDQILDMLRQTGLAFFSIEKKLRRWDNAYGGHFHAPHALSFALAGLIMPVRPNVLLYGLAHPNVALAGRVFRQFQFSRTLVVANTDNGLHFIDEVGIFGNTRMYGSTEGLASTAGFVHVGEELQLPPYTRKDIAPATTVEENVAMGLDVLKGVGRPAHEDLVAVNAGTILHLSEQARDLREGYAIAKNVIKSGVAIQKLRDVIKISGGNVSLLKNF